MPLPPLTGDPIRVVIRRSLGPHVAATSIPRRVIYLDRQVLVERGDFERILVHELFHFAWVHLGNSVRREWELVLEAELARGDRGELGWSAEWRKKKLSASVISLRTTAWRRYVCESFCDTAAWMFAGLADHDEFTLPVRARRRRHAWFARNFSSTPVRI